MGHTTKDNSEMFSFREFPGYTLGGFIPVGVSDLRDEIQGKTARRTWKTAESSQEPSNLGALESKGPFFLL